MLIITGIAIAGPPSGLDTQKAPQIESQQKPPKVSSETSKDASQGTPSEELELLEQLEMLETLEMLQDLEFYKDLDALLQQSPEEPQKED
jgi:ribosome assembly protein YihI (activator of Der GTPase)